MKEREQERGGLGMQRVRTGREKYGMEILNRVVMKALLRRWDSSKDSTEMRASGRQVSEGRAWGQGSYSMWGNCIRVTTHSSVNTVFPFLSIVVILYMCACMCAKSLQSCSTLWDAMDYSPPGYSVHGILQARILEWVAISSSRGSTWPRDLRTPESYVSCIGRRCLPLAPAGKPNTLYRM